MTTVTINLQALKRNIEQINLWMDRANASWTLVTKVLCGQTETLKALQMLGVRSMGDSRLENLAAIERLSDDVETWYLRLPHKTAIPEIITSSDVSLNSEIETIEALDEEARRQGRRHKIIIMIELGDLREGILPSHLVSFYESISKLENIELLGIGANLGCLSGTVPNIDQMTQLILYRELLELKFKIPLPMISAGSTIMLPLMLQDGVPPEINHYRIGEAVFLGTDLINNTTLPGLRDDAVTLSAEIVEVKEKSLTPVVETATSIRPFEEFASGIDTPGQRGYRVLVAVGHLDTDVHGLTPVNSQYRISGAASDLTIVNVGEENPGLQVGDTLDFRMNYSALLRSMSSKYVDKRVTPELDSFDTHTPGERTAKVPHAIQDNGGD